MKLKQSQSKAILKTITWRIIASATTFILAILFFGDDPNAKEKAAGIAVVETIVKMLFYYYHERVWHNITKRKYTKPIPIPNVNSPIIVNKERRDIMTQKRAEFIKTHRSLIEKARKENNHQGEIGKELLQKAREEIGYSSNTSSWDIHRTLIMSI